MSLDIAKIAYIIKKSAEIEDMIRSGEVDVNKIVNVLRYIGFSKSQLDEIVKAAEEYKQTGDEIAVIERISKALGLNVEQVKNAMAAYYSLTSLIT